MATILFDAGKIRILQSFLSGSGGIGATSIGLSTTAPNADGSNITEPTGGSYARVNYAGSMDTPSGNSVTNDEIIYFPETTGSWGTVTHYVLFNGNTPIIGGPLSQSVNIPSGYVPLIRVGQLNLSVAAGA